MKKRLFEFKTDHLLAACAGVSMFALLRLYGRFTLFGVEVHTAYGLCGHLSTLFGPIAGFISAFSGQYVADTLGQGAITSRCFASGVCCLLMGLCYTRLNPKEGRFTGKDALQFNICQVLANMLSWLVISPALEGLLHSQRYTLEVLTQGLLTVLSNSVSTAVIGTLLLFLYSRIYSRKLAKARAAKAEAETE